MAGEATKIRGDLTAAHAAALRVHDSPVRADELYKEIERIAGRLPLADLGEEKTTRVAAALADAMRVLRRDEDGREAAKHLQSALRFFEPAERKPSPFLEDL